MLTVNEIILKTRLVFLCPFEIKKVKTEKTLTLLTLLCTLSCDQKIVGRDMTWMGYVV